MTPVRRIIDGRREGRGGGLDGAGPRAPRRGAHSVRGGAATAEDVSVRRGYDNSWIDNVNYTILKSQMLKGNED